MGLEELTNIRNVERLKKELRVRLQYASTEVRIPGHGYSETNTSQLPLGQPGQLTLEPCPAGLVF